MGLNHEKTGGQKSLDTLPLSAVTPYFSPRHVVCWFDGFGLAFNNI